MYVLERYIDGTWKYVESGPLDYLRRRQAYLETLPNTRVYRIRPK
mgnify:CR=1|jgi:hypothetical protein